MLKLVVIHIVSDIILEIVMSFDTVLKVVIDISIAGIYDLIYHSFILIINYH